MFVKRQGVSGTVAPTPATDARPTVTHTTLIVAPVETITRTTLRLPTENPVYVTRTILYNSDGRPTAVPGGVDGHMGSDQPHHHDREQPVAAIAGGIVGGIVALILIGLLVWVHLRRRANIDQRLQTRKRWRWAAYIDKLRNTPQDAPAVVETKEKKGGEKLAIPENAVVYGDKDIQEYLPRYSFVDARPSDTKV